MPVYRKVKVIFTGKRIDPGESIRSPADAVLKMKGEMEKLTIENFFVLLLDARHRVIGVNEISRGTISGTLVHPRETFVTAIKTLSSAIILVHNHPSGNPAPSTEDIELTKRMISAGNILGIPVLDHIIVGLDSHFSIRQKNEELFK
jgi:DNA repair protein RadC